MLWWQNIPLFSIILCLLSAAACTVLPSRGARILGRSALVLCAAAASALLGILLSSGAPAFPYRMGHFPAPWGNEIRCGALEALMAAFFPAVMACCLAAGAREPSARTGIGGSNSRENLLYALCLLLMTSLLAQIYSNDLFTSYVFVEIMTLSACGLIAFRNTGRALAGAMRYMVLNLVGSGLFLLGVALLYDLTGHLLMENLRDALRATVASGAYHRSLTIILALLTVGLGIKSALFPFHVWAPDAYSSGDSASNAILSSLVSKGYILLLMKIYARVFSWDLVLLSGVNRILMLFALLGMVVGSLQAIMARDFLRMTACSSVAQIGYIYLGISLGAGAGYQAAVFHLIVHSLAKALLFLSGDALCRAAGGERRLDRLSGIARRTPAAGVLWTLGAFTLVGLPFTGGLVSKLLLGGAAMAHSLPVRISALGTLALSTLLNVLYFLRAALIFWSPEGRPAVSFPASDALPVPEAPRASDARSAFSRSAALPACCALAAGAVLSFFLASPLLRVLELGLTQF